MLQRSQEETLSRGQLGCISSALFVFHLRLENTLLHPLPDMLQMIRVENLNLLFDNHGHLIWPSGIPEQQQHMVSGCPAFTWEQSLMGNLPFQTQLGSLSLGYFRVCFFLFSFAYLKRELNRLQLKPLVYGVENSFLIEATRNASDLVGCEGHLQPVLEKLELVKYLPWLTSHW